MWSSTHIALLQKEFAQELENPKKTFSGKKINEFILKYQLRRNQPQVRLKLHHLRKNCQPEIADKEKENVKKTTTKRVVPSSIYTVFSNQLKNKTVPTDSECIASLSSPSLQKYTIRQIKDFVGKIIKQHEYSSESSED